MDEVKIGEHLAFQGPPSAGHFGVCLKNTFVNAGDSVPVDDTLPAFFTELWKLWRGWSGERVWESAAGNLTLAARHDGVGHVLIVATLKDWGVGLDADPSLEQSGQWAASVAVEVEPAALRTIASGLRDLLAADTVE